MPGQNSEECGKRPVPTYDAIAESVCNSPYNKRVGHCVEAPQQILLIFAFWIFRCSRWVDVMDDCTGHTFLSLNPR